MTTLFKAGVVLVPVLLVLLLLRACAREGAERWAAEIQDYDPDARVVLDDEDLVVIASKPAWGARAGRHALAFKRFLSERHGDLLGHGRDRPLLFFAFSTLQQMQQYYTDTTGERVHPGGFHDPARGAIFVAVGASLETIRHETVHLLMSESFRGEIQLSPWLVEGLPEAFSRVDPQHPEIGPGTPDTDRAWVRTTYLRQRFDLHRLLGIEDYAVFWKDPERNYRDARSLVAFLIQKRPEDFDTYLAYERNSAGGRAKAFRDLFQTEDRAFESELHAFLTSE